VAYEGFYICLCISSAAMVSVCDSNPCLNSGTCLNQGPNLYKCVCAHGFRGKNCESKRNRVAKLAKMSLVILACPGPMSRCHAAV